MTVRISVFLLAKAGCAGLLLALAAPVAARAQSANYVWVSASTPPANVVTAPDAPHRAVCKGTGDYGRMWVGFWDGRMCIGAYGGMRQFATANIQFLTLVSGTAHWVSGTGKRFPSEIGTIPSDTINAGNTYTRIAQVLCSQDGYIGWIWQNTCSIAPAPPWQRNATVLVGAMFPVYTWTSASAPPGNAVVAPDSPNHAVCRGNDQNGYLWAGYWNGTQCVGSWSGNQELVTVNLQFLTASGATQWVSGSGKTVPGDIGALPANTINAGSTYTGIAQVLCSQGGYVGWAYQNQCQIFATGVSMQQNATVLTGIAQ